MMTRLQAEGKTGDADSAESVLTPGQVREFHERGVLKADFQFPEKLLDDLIAAVYPLYDEDYRAGRSERTRIQDAWREVPEARRLAVEPKVLDALQELMGRRAKPFQTLNFPVGTSQLAHSDTIHFSTIPEGYMLGVWVALEDIDRDNGPLVYYPGSHKLPYLKMHDLGLRPGYGHYPAYEQKIQELIRREKLQAEYGVARKGEAIIWHANLLHGGAPRRDPQRTRHSQVTHYYFEGCRYYTPMDSSRLRRRFREPVWIPVSDAEFSRGDHLRSPSLSKRVRNRLGRVLDRIATSLDGLRRHD